MRLVLGLLIAATSVGSAVAEPVRARSTCDATAERVAQVVGGDRTKTVVASIARRCEADRWSTDAQLCLGAAPTDLAAGRCLDKLTKDQQRQLAGEVDRMPVDTRSRRLASWLTHRSALALAVSPTTPGPGLFTLAVATGSDLPRARLLHAQGMTAYQTGHYDLAIRRFTAANDASPSAELLYHLAQSYRLKGDRADALELYERYLTLAPTGAAADDCHRQIEKLAAP